jgi:hypothetical protein
MRTVLVRVQPPQPPSHGGNFCHDNGSRRSLLFAGTAPSERRTPHPNRVPSLVLFFAAPFAMPISVASGLCSISAVTMAVENLGRPTVMAKAMKAARIRTGDRIQPGWLYCGLLQVVRFAVTWATRGTNLLASKRGWAQPVSAVACFSRSSVTPVNPSFQIKYTRSADLTCQ